MKRSIGFLIRLFLGIDDTEVSVNQVNYLKDISKNTPHLRVSSEGLITFIESIQTKHELDEIGLFKDGIPIFCSDNMNLEKSNSIYELYNKSKKISNNEILMIKDNGWLTLYEKEKFVFILKKTSKMSEFEINAVTNDILKNLDKVIVEEKTMMDSLLTRR